MSEILTAGELLQVPTTGLNSTAGAVHLWAEEIDNTEYRVLLDLPGALRVSLWPATGWRLWTPGGQADAAWQGGRRLYTVRWSDGAASLLIDGVQVASVPVANLPGTFPALLTLGADATNEAHCCAYVGPVHLLGRVPMGTETAKLLRYPLRFALPLDADGTDLEGRWQFAGSLFSNNRYLAFPFEITLPDDTDEGIVSARLMLDNVDRRIVQAVRVISSPADIDLVIVLSSSPWQLEAGPYPFQLSGVSWDALTVEGDLGYSSEILGQRYPADAMTPANFPGMFA